MAAATTTTTLTSTLASSTLTTTETFTTTTPTTTPTTTTAATSTPLNTPPLYILTTIEISAGSTYLIPGSTVPFSTYTVTPSTTAATASSAIPTTVTSYTTLPSTLTTLASPVTTASAIATIPFASLFPSASGIPIGDPQWAGSSPFGAMYSQTVYALSNMQKIAIGLGISLGVVLCVIAAVVGYWYILRRREKRLRQYRNSLDNIPGPPELSSPNGSANERSGSYRRAPLSPRSPTSLYSPMSPRSPMTLVGPTRSGRIPPKRPRRSDEDAAPRRGGTTRTRTGTGDSRVEFANPGEDSLDGRQTSMSEARSEGPWGRLRSEASGSPLGTGMPVKAQEAGPGECLYPVAEERVTLSADKPLPTVQFRCHNPSIDPIEVPKYRNSSIPPDHPFPQHPLSPRRRIRYKLNSSPDDPISSHAEVHLPAQVEAHIRNSSTLPRDRELCEQAARSRVVATVTL